MGWVDGYCQQELISSLNIDVGHIPAAFGYYPYKQMSIFFIYKVIYLSLKMTDLFAVYLQIFLLLFNFI